jgi:hypothetical protein
VTAPSSSRWIEAAVKNQPGPGRAAGPVESDGLSRVRRATRGRQRRGSRRGRDPPILYREGRRRRCPAVE